MLVSAKCPNCGANVKVNPNNDSGVCEHCGTTFMTETVMNNYNITNVINNHIVSDNVEVTHLMGQDEGSLVKRIFGFIEDRNWKKAGEYCEKVLDINPENANVYLAKLFIDLKIVNVDSLKYQEKSFSNNTNYKKAIKYGDNDLKVLLSGYEKIVNENVKIIKSIKERRTSLICNIVIGVLLFSCILYVSLTQYIIPKVNYNKAIELYNNGQYEQAYEIFLALDDFKDSSTKAYEIKKILTEQKYFYYDNMLIKFPNNKEFNVIVEDDVIKIKALNKNSGYLDMSDFLNYINPPEGKTFSINNEYVFDITDALGKTKRLQRNDRGEYRYYFSNWAGSGWASYGSIQLGITKIEGQYRDIDNKNDISSFVIYIELIK